MVLSFSEIEAGKPKPSRQPLPRTPFQFYPIAGSQSCGEKHVISCACWEIGLYMVIPCHQPMVARLRFHQLLSFVPSCYISSKVFQKICTVPDNSWTMQPGRSHGTRHSNTMHMTLQHTQIHPVSSKAKRQRLKREGQVDRVPSRSGGVEEGAALPQMQKAGVPWFRGLSDFNP